jgi:flagellar biosynthesis protein FlhB
MAEEQHGDRTLDPTAKRIEQARAQGDVPISREASSAGLLLAVLLAIAGAGAPMARRIGGLLVPFLDQPEQLLDGTAEGYRTAAGALAGAIAAALAPFFLLALAGTLLPYLVQNSVVMSAERLTPKLSNLSPARGIKRMFGARALFEFAKSCAKLIAVVIACYVVGRPFYDQSVGLVAVDLAAFPAVFGQAVQSLLLAVALVGVVIAAIDVPYQHWAWRRRLRMSAQELREELRSTDGDPQVKARQRKLRRKRGGRRMMREVPKASVVITNPTHVAVALKYQSGIDTAPVVVAKGAELVARRIRAIAVAHGVAVIEDRPLARALHEAVEIGETIPRAHFQAVAKIIGLVWSRRVGASMPSS